jgi:hypothetical protein
MTLWRVQPKPKKEMRSASAKKVTAKKVSRKNQMKKVNGLDVQTSFFHLLFSRKFRPLETNDVHGSTKCKQRRGATTKKEIDEMD